MELGYGSLQQGCIMQQLALVFVFYIACVAWWSNRELSQPLSSPLPFKQCDQLVKQYEPVAVQLLAEMMDPNFVCGVSITARMTVRSIHSKLGLLNKNQHCSNIAGPSYLEQFGLQLPYHEANKGVVLQGLWLRWRACNHLSLPYSGNRSQGNCD